MKFKPMTDIILVEVIEEKMTSGGLHIVSKDSTDPKRGRIVCKGPKVLELKKGSEVLFPYNYGEETRLEGKDYLLMREKDILAVVE
jgi:chaperonin GroES